MELEPGQTYGYRIGENVRGDLYARTYVDEWPYEGYREELERREEAEGIDLDLPVDLAPSPLNITLRKFGLRCDWRDIAYYFPGEDPAAFWNDFKNAVLRDLQNRR